MTEQEQGRTAIEQAWSDSVDAGSGTEARWACQDCDCTEYAGSGETAARCRCGHWWDRHYDEPPGAGADPFGRTAADWERHAE